MAGTRLLALLDDIASLLDDISVMSKVAAKKTAGVLGDDLALNAEQVSGVRADRELPVIWAVAKGSLRSKLILVPVALLIGAFAPWLVTLLLMVGGLYLSFEGFEKVFHCFFHRHLEAEEQQLRIKKLGATKTDLMALEKEKIEGAIRTDFILSAEIIVIALGSVQDANLLSRIIVVSLITLIMTAGLYLLVAAIVRLDDAGQMLLEKHAEQACGQFCLSLGKGLLNFAPKLMKGITLIGTLAMFLVGGGILLHGLPWPHHWSEYISETIHQLPAVGTFFSSLSTILLNLVTGLIAGSIVMLIVSIGKKLVHSRFK